MIVASRSGGAARKCPSFSFCSQTNGGIEGWDHSEPRLGLIVVGPLALALGSWRWDVNVT